MPRRPPPAPPAPGRGPRASPADRPGSCAPPRHSRGSTATGAPAGAASPPRWSRRPRTGRNRSRPSSARRLGAVAGSWYIGSQTFRDPTRPLGIPLRPSHAGRADAPHRHEWRIGARPPYDPSALGGRRVRAAAGAALFRLRVATGRRRIGAFVPTRPESPLRLLHGRTSPRPPPNSSNPGRPAASLAGVRRGTPDPSAPARGASPRPA